MAHLEYIVLTDPDVDLDSVVELTGRAKEVLQHHIGEAEKIGHHLVLWHEFNTWFTVRVDAMFVHDGLLDEVMQQILRRPH